MIKAYPNSYQAYKLFHKSTDVFSDIEEHGIRVNTDYCYNKINELDKKKKELFNKIIKSEFGVGWRKFCSRKRKSFNINSDSQLAEYLYKDLKITPPKFTKKSEENNKKGSVDEESLHKVQEDNNIDGLQDFLYFRKYIKANDYLKLWMREQVNGIIHPFFALHTVTSFRGSSSAPNFQNIPNRDKEMRKILRPAIIPFENSFLAELDFKALEVNISCCYHQDEKMIEYVSNDSLDMHWDMAKELLFLDDSQKTKDIRYVGKNGFVFPQFYGSWWKDCSANIWDMIEGTNLPDNTPLKTWLSKNGIKQLGEPFKNMRGFYEPQKGTFMEHVKNVEYRFWKEIFTAYDQWKQDWWENYKKTGFIDLLTGFRCKGAMRKNQVLNMPIQGSAFHVLLLTMNKMHDILITKNWKSRIIGQIHDSIVLNIHPQEWYDLQRLAMHIVMDIVPKEWKWINVPLTIEAERASVNKSWYFLREVELAT